jgi:hypothetical protein
MALLLVHVAKWCTVASVLVIAVSGCHAEQEQVPGIGIAPSAVIVR